MDLWSGRCLKMDHASKMHCSAAAPCDETNSFQEAATKPPPAMKYSPCVYLFAEKVPRPPSPPPADAVFHMGDALENILKTTGFRSLDDDPKRRNLLPPEVPLPQIPLPPAEDVFHMGDAHEKKNSGFPSSDDEAACLMSRLLMACDVPLPPSPPPADAARHVRHFHQTKYPDFSDTWFPSLDDEVPNLMPLSWLAEIPLPPSPLPHADDVLDVDEKKYPDSKNTGIPPLDDDPKRPNLLPHQVPLSPSPPPADDVFDTDLKKYPDLKNTGFPPLDGDTDPKHPNLLPHEIPLPPSPPPPEDVLDIEDTHVKNLFDIGFPSLDDEMACLMSKFPPLDDDPKCPNLSPHEIPLPPSPPLPPADDVSDTNEKKYPDLKNIVFPCLDDNPKRPNLSLQEVPLPPSCPYGDAVLHMSYKKKYPDLKNIRFPSLDDEEPDLMPLRHPLPPSYPRLAEQKYLDLSIVAFPCLDDDI
ncbi:uncharacterized protein LOC141763110 [Sebastes fasciatus]|uniref:uncharacterized protein LOC141763110 n=1 Tax=Sebastes fasciatus TaxID=394691 RepID=UPI003D9F610E